MNKNKYYYPAVFHPEESGYSVWVPDLSGCFSQGETIQEAAEMITEAIELFLEWLFDHEKVPSSPSDPQSIAVKDGEFIMLVECDLLSYQKKHNNKSVKKTLTIPEWLNTLAEENNINFSNVLQTALKEKLNVS